MASGCRDVIRLSPSSRRVLSIISMLAQLVSELELLDLCLSTRRLDLDLTAAQQRASDAYAQAHAKRLAFVMNTLAPLLPRASTVFSVGSMPNLLELLFARLLEAKVIGSTYSPRDKRDKFTAVYEQQGGWRYEMTVYLRDLTRDPIPLDTHSCDGVLCFEVVEHFLESPLALFREAQRVLKPDGLLLLSTPNMQHWHRLLYTLNGMTYPDLDFEEPIESRHTHIFSLRELRALLERAGFDVVTHFFEDPWNNATHMAQFDQHQRLNGKLLELLGDAAEFQHECMFLVARPAELRPVLTNGWHTAEWEGEDWYCWSAGRGEMRVVAKHDTDTLLSGAIYSIQRPNLVDVIVNGVARAAIQITWQSFQPFAPIRLPLRAGENVVSFVSNNSAVTLPTDTRPLAVAVKNLRITVGDREQAVAPSDQAP